MTYTVERGDCMWAIAQKVFGDGRRWREIWKANEKVLGRNISLIYPGQKLIIPEGEK